MTRLWEENKPLLVVAAVCVLLFLVLRPTIASMGPPLARWMGASWKSEYDEFEQKGKQLEDQLEPFYPRRGGAKISDIAIGVENSNLYLKQNFDQYVHALAFVPHRPFRPPLKRREREWGLYFRGTLAATSDALLRYCSFRFVTVTPDLGFTDIRKGRAVKGSEVPDLLRNLAAAETFVKLCADSHIKATEIARYLGAENVGTSKGRKGFIREHSMQVKLTAGFPELMRLLQSLDGRQCLVKDVEIDKLRDVVEKVTLNIGSSSGVRPDQQFTIFKRSPDAPCKLAYSARVVVTSVAADECVARIFQDSLPFDPFDPQDAKLKEKLRVQAGDLASTGFFRVKSLAIESVPGRIREVDDEGIPTDVIPHTVNANMTVSTFSFDTQSQYLTPANVAKLTGRKPVKHLQPKKKGPGPTNTGSGVPPPGRVIRSF
jgi:hypothetical protein